jgi:hypothetical protein
VDGQLRKHVPDYLWDTADGLVVADVVRAERLTNPSIARVCAWTRAVVESLGWSYHVVSEPPSVNLANVRFLAGYRRDWLINPGILDQLRCRAAELAGMCVAEAEQQITDQPHPLVRSALMHLLWRQEFTVDLTRPLRPSTVLGAVP